MIVKILMNVQWFPRTNLMRIVVDIYLLQTLEAISHWADVKAEIEHRAISKLCIGLAHKSIFSVGWF